MLMNKENESVAAVDTYNRIIYVTSDNETLDLFIIIIYFLFSENVGKDISLDTIHVCAIFACSGISRNADIYPHDEIERQVI